MLTWEYAALTANMKRNQDKVDEWTVRGFLSSADGGQYRFYEATFPVFKRLEYLALFGIEGWELIDTSTNRVTYPGTGIGLGSDNRTAGVHSVNLYFRRPLQRQITDAERAAAARFFRPGGGT